MQGLSYSLIVSFSTRSLDTLKQIRVCQKATEHIYRMFSKLISLSNSQHAKGSHRFTWGFHDSFREGLPGQKNNRHIEDSPLATSLLDLDLSNNSLQRVEALPPNARTQISFNNGDLSFATGVLAKARRFSLTKSWIKVQLDWANA